MDNNRYTEQTQPRDNYYQNLYNMFGGYNPIVDKQANSIRRLGILAGSGMILYMVIQNVIAIALRTTGLIELYTNDPVYMSGINIIAQFAYIFIPFFIIYIISTPKEKARILVFEKPRSPQLTTLAIFAGFGICIASNFAGSIINVIFSMLGVDFITGSEDLPMPKNIIGIFLMVLGNAVVAPLLEEFAFRGVILQTLRKHGDRFAIIMSAILFGIMHGNMVQIPFAIVVGIALGYFCIATNSIWTSVIIHALNNLLAVVISLLCETQLGISDFAYYVLELAILIIGIIAFFVFRKANTFKLRKDSGELNKKLKAALYLCIPTVVIGIGNSLYTTVSLQTTSSAFGGIVLIAIIVVVAVFLIKGVNYIKSDTRLTQRRTYTASKIFTIILLIFGIFLVIGSSVNSLMLS